MAVVLVLAADGAAARKVATPSAPAYDAFVARGVAQGQRRRFDEAAASFDRAIALNPARPEAWLERGGLHFLERRYPEAARDLRRALERREDAYARELLGSALYLSGRTDEAVGCWNVLGRPTLRTITIGGLAHTRDHVVRRELSLAEGARLDLDELRASRRRLREAGVFGRVILRPVPLGEGRADLLVALAEQHGFGRGVADLLVTTGVNGLEERVALRYANLGGRGLTLGGWYRWEENRPGTLLFVQWPRPFGLPAYLRVQGFRGRQAYALDQPFEARRRGLDLSLRSVLGARTVAAAGFRFRRRSFTVDRGDAPPGAVVGIDVGLERRLVEGHRHRLDAGLRGFHAMRFLGSNLSYAQAGADLGYEVSLAEPELVKIERSVLAARVRWGWGDSRMPVDEMFAPGGSPDMELPLRAHPQTRDGVLGQTPIGRSLLLWNVEWRRRLARRAGVELGAVLFHDGARIAGAPAARAATLADVGAGLRLTFPGAPILRVDFGHGLTDGANAVFFGLSSPR
jgi:hypothetical protein